MKKNILLIALVSISLCTFSQLKHGMEVGGNMMGADITINETLDSEYSWGIRIGYVGEYLISDRLFIRAAGLINQRGFQYGDERWGLNVVDVPVNIGYGVGLNDKSLQWFIDGGLDIEYNFRAFTKVDDELVTINIGPETEDIKAMAVGFNVGTGLQFTQQLKVRLSYYRGLTNLVRTEGDSWNNYVFGLA